MNMHGCGVNFGGWFIPEKWMTPTLFANGEHDTSTLFSSQSGRARYSAHVEHFIIEDDVAWCATNNVRFIRLPVAWWMFDEANEMSSICLKKLDWFMKRAEEVGIDVLLDMHALKGSQNGKDHSGAAGSIKWAHYFKENVQLVECAATRYKASPSFWGIELCNEPALLHNYFLLQRFYRVLVRRLKKDLPTQIKIVLHDGFHPLLSAWVLQTDMRVLLDLHLYNVPLKNGDNLRTYLDRRDRTYARRIKLVNYFQLVLIGEWSGVLPAELLKGMSQLERTHAIENNIHRQVNLYNAALGWTFWSYKTEDKTMWNFKNLVEHTSLFADNSVNEDNF